MWVDGQSIPTTRGAALATPLEAAGARLLSLAGMLVFLSMPLVAIDGHQLIFTGEVRMWVKVLGLICAGVFVGAAVIEAKQLLRDRKAKKPGDEAEDGAAAAEAAAVEGR